MFRTLVAASLMAVLPVAFASTAVANPRGGSLSGTYRAPAYGTAVHEIVYNGGERADFAIVGDGDTALNIVVKDNNGNVVVRTTGPGDRAHVNWTPLRTGVFRIYIINSGGVYNQYNWRAF